MVCWRKPPEKKRGMSDDYELMANSCKRFFNRGKTWLTGRVNVSFQFKKERKNEKKALNPEKYQTDP